MLESCPDDPAQIESEIRAALKLQSTEPLTMIERTLGLLDRSERLGSQRCIALACQVLGGAYRRSSDARNAERYLTRALATSGANSTLAANVRIQLGALANESRQFESALFHLNCALDIHRKNCDSHGIAIVEFNLGNHFRLQQQNIVARGHYSKSISLYSQSNDESGVSINLAALGYLARDRRDFEEAEFRFSTSQEILFRLNDLHNYAKLFVERAVIRAATGDYTLAALYIRRAEMIGKQAAIPAISYNARLLEAMISFRSACGEHAYFIAKAMEIAADMKLSISREEIQQIAKLVLDHSADDFMQFVEDLLRQKNLAS